jgi:hypothetical protein
MYVYVYAFFSPNPRAFVQPDVVAPGYTTISARSGGYSKAPTCQVVENQGTSMAAPGT